MGPSRLPGVATWIMKASFVNFAKGIRAYIQKSVGIDGKSTPRTIRRLGLLDDIKQTYCWQDPRQWVMVLAACMAPDEKRERNL